MRQQGNWREPARRASSLYHLSVRINYEAGKVADERPLTPNERRIVSIFNKAIERARKRVLEEYNVQAR